MGVNKLDIEFEDEEEIQAREEAERKKKEVLENVDLEFDVEGSDAPASEAPVEEAKKEAPKKERPVKKASKEESPEKEAPRPAKKEKTKEVPKEVVEEVVAAPESKVENKVENTQKNVEPIRSTEQFQQIPQAQVMIGPDYKLGDELKKTAASNQILAIEIEARVKVEVAKEMTKTVADFHAKNKMLEYKINKILTQMHKKAPALKAELMTIKRYLKENASLDEEEESSEQEVKPQSKRPAKKKAA